MRDDDLNVAESLSTIIVLGLVLLGLCRMVWQKFFPES